LEEETKRLTGRGEPITGDVIGEVFGILYARGRGLCGGCKT